jgi:hypothetical protein
MRCEGSPTCIMEAESIVDVVRAEDDGSSTFFTVPICYGHRLALGEHVIRYETLSRPDSTDSPVSP